MSEPELRRIVVACDAACDIRVAVEDAANLAARWKASLHGIFLEDENLFRLADLPFGRQAMLSSALSEGLNRAEIERLSSASGAAMRRALRDVAMRRGLEWSFGIVRDLPGVAALARFEADMLVVEAATRPFSGSWRPRSAWDALAEGRGRTVLMRRRRRSGPGTVVMLLDGGAARDKVLSSGLALVAPGDDVVLLMGAHSAAESVAVTEAAESLGRTLGPKIRAASMAPEKAALFRQIERLDPTLIVIDAAAVERSFIDDVCARTRADILTVG